MKIIRVILYDGDDEWIQGTRNRSLPEGESSGLFGKDRKIFTKTIQENDVDFPDALDMIRRG